MDDESTSRNHANSSGTQWLVALVGLTFPSLITWVYFVAMAEQPGHWQQASYLIGKGLQFALPVVWVFAILKRRVERPLWPLRGILAGLGFGLLVTAGGYLLFRFVLLPGGLFDAAESRIAAKVAGLGISGLGQYLALALFYALFHSLLEEYYWRWFLFDLLRSLTRLPVAVAVSAVGFAAHHVIVLAQFFGWWSPATLFFAAAVGIGGAVWAILYDRTESLTVPWLSHLVIDAGIFLIGYELVRTTLH